MTKQPHLSVQTGLDSIIPFGVHVSPPNTVLHTQPGPHWDAGHAQASDDPA